MISNCFKCLLLSWDLLIHCWAQNFLWGQRLCAWCNWLLHKNVDIIYITSSRSHRTLWKGTSCSCQSLSLEINLSLLFIKNICISLYYSIWCFVRIFLLILEVVENLLSGKLWAIILKYGFLEITSLRKSSTTFLRESWWRLYIPIVWKQVCRWTKRIIIYLVIHLSLENRVLMIIITQSVAWYLILLYFIIYFFWLDLSIPFHQLAWLWFGNTGLLKLISWIFNAKWSLNLMISLNSFVVLNLWIYASPSIFFLEWLWRG